VSLALWQASLTQRAASPSPTDCAQHGHRANSGQRAGGAQVQLVDDAVCARLDVEELLVGRSRRVDGTRVCRGLTTPSAMSATEMG
jgi:hypothetical protein